MQAISYLLSVCLLDILSSNACVSAPYTTLDTTSLADWKQRVDGQQATTLETHQIMDKPDKCYGINPCIRLIGLDPSDNRQLVYIERTLDSSLWSNVTFAIDFYTSNFDNDGENGFFETECSGNVVRNNFQYGVNGQYSGCFNRTTKCNELIIRIGAYMSGPGDYLWISRVVYKSTPSQVLNCVAASHISLDTTSFTDWEQKIVPQRTKKTETFLIQNDPSKCYGINPCIRLIGVDPNAVNENVYIERTLDSSLWSNVNFGIDFTAQWLDDIDEYGFFETECNGNIERNTFLRDQNTKVRHVDCFYRATPCDELIIRIGGNLDGALDYLWISQVVYQSSSPPTTYPTNLPTNTPSSSPTFDPSPHPTLIPTSVPTNEPTTDPSTHPTFILTLTPSKHPTSVPTILPTLTPIIGCISAPYITLDTTSFTDWEQKIAPQRNPTSETFLIQNNHSNCYGINPCIRLIGVDPNGENEDVYIERTLDSSLWSDVHFGIDFTIERLDAQNEYAFFETECDGNTERDALLNGIDENKKYSGCFYRATPCVELVIRIGGRLSGPNDYVWISRIVYQSSSNSPTKHPTASPTGDSSKNPTNYLTWNPSMSPTRIPSSMPIKALEQPDQNFDVTATQQPTNSDEHTINSVANIFKNEMMIIILTLGVLLLLAGIIILVLWKRNDQRHKTIKIMHTNMAIEIGSVNHVIQANASPVQEGVQKMIGIAQNQSKIPGAIVAINDEGNEENKLIGNVAAQEAVLSDLYDEMMYTDSEDSVFEKTTSGGGQNKTVTSSGASHCGDV